LIFIAYHYPKASRFHINPFFFSHNFALFLQPVNVVTYLFVVETGLLFKGIEINAFLASLLFFTARPFQSGPIQTFFPIFLLTLD